MSKRRETWWVTPEFARLNRPLIARRKKSRAQSEYLSQFGPAFSAGRNKQLAVFECLACGAFCVADIVTVSGGRKLSCGCKSLRREQIPYLPEFAATAKCECGSFDTTTLATQPEKGTRYHRCNAPNCGKRFHTRMAEVSQIGGK